MNSFKDFRGALITGLVAVLLSIAGYLYADTTSEIEENRKGLIDQGQRIVKLEVIVTQQAEINKELKEILRAMSRERFTFTPRP